MSLWTVLTSLLVGRGRRKRMKDLDRELQSHLDLEAEEQEQSGRSGEESRYAARRALGNTTLIADEIQAIGTLPWLEGLLRDLRYGTRALRKNLGFTAVAVLTLALGIGANTAIFTAMDALMLRPLPFSQPDQLVRFYAT